MKGLWHPNEQEAVESKLNSAIVGSPATVKAGLERLLLETQADEIIAVTDLYDHHDRLNSYSLLADIASELTVVTAIPAALHA
jgi:alkanesulfonate monooxygenase SsuD/methylene tetrahydromethanopterin reductase-like flavin-dependent oxidoreductase (luciferase family)